MNLSWLQLIFDKFAYYVSNEKLLVKDHRLVEIRGIDPFFKRFSSCEWWLKILLMSFKFYKWYILGGMVDFISKWIDTFLYGFLPVNDG